MPSNVDKLSTPRIFLKKTQDVSTTGTTLKRMTWEPAATSNVITAVDITYSTGTSQSGTSGHIIINTEGMYFISGFVIFQSGGDTNYRRVQIVTCDQSDNTLANTSDYQDFFIGTGIESLSYNTYIPFSTTRYLNKNDRVKLQFAHNSTTNIDVLGTVGSSSTCIQLALVSSW